MLKATYKIVAIISCFDDEENLWATPLGFFFFFFTALP